MSKQCRSRLARQARSFQVTLCSFILAGILAFSLIFVASPAQASADDELTPLVYTANVHSLTQLVEAISDPRVTDHEIEITITGLFDIDTTVSIPDGKTVKITSVTPTRTLQRSQGFDGSLFSVEPGASLTIENVHLNGMGNTSPTLEASAPLITVAAGGSLNLSADAQLSANNNTNTTQAESGGAINNAGTTTIAGATIDLNTANYGGGIYNSGTLILHDDTVITDNIAHVYGGGVYNSGEVLMEDGFISENTALGLGAEIYDDGTITVSGTVKIGLRENNSGIYLLPTRTLTIAAAGLTQDTLIFIEALGSSDTEAGRVVATLADGSAATTAEARLFAYLPDTYGVAAQGGTSSYILAASELRVTPASLAFGKTAVGSKSTTLAVTVTGITLDNPLVLSAPAGFLIQEGSDWDALLGGTVYITFAPTQAGDIKGVLTIASGSNTQSVNLSGTTFTDNALSQTGDPLVPLLAIVGGFVLLAAAPILFFTRRALSRD